MLFLCPSVLFAKGCENSQDYAQKPQGNYTVVNSVSVRAVQMRKNKICSSMHRVHGRDEILGHYLPSQLERTLQRCM
jgi:hypothetical protein